MIHWTNTADFRNNIVFRKAIEICCVTITTFPEFKTSRTTNLRASTKKGNTRKAIYTYYICSR